MAEDSKTGLTVLTTIVSAISGFAVAYLAFATNKDENAIKQQQIAMEQTKFDAEQRKRRDDALEKLLPKIFGSSEADRKSAMATLLILFPSDAQKVQAIVEASASDPKSRGSDKGLEPLLEQAKTTAAQSDSWLIVVGGDKTIEAARAEVLRASKAGLSASLYLKAGVYRTTIGPFPMQVDAQSANIAVRTTLRGDAYVVNLKSWCPGAVDKTEYVECGAIK